MTAWLGLIISTLSAIAAVLKEASGSQRRTEDSLLRRVVADPWSVTLISFCLLGASVGVVGLIEQNGEERRLTQERDSTLVLAAGGDVSPTIRLGIPAVHTAEMEQSYGAEETLAREGRESRPQYYPAAEPKGFADQSVTRLLAPGAFETQVERLTLPFARFRFPSGLWDLRIYVANSGYFDYSSNPTQFLRQAKVGFTHKEAVFIFRYGHAYSRLSLYLDTMQRFRLKSSAFNISFPRPKNVKLCRELRTSEWARALSKATIVYDLDDNARIKLVSKLTLLSLDDDTSNGNECVGAWRLNEEPHLEISPAEGTVLR